MGTRPTADERITALILEHLSGLPLCLWSKER